MAVAGSSSSVSWGWGGGSVYLVPSEAESVATVAHLTVERPKLWVLLQLSQPMTPAEGAQNTNFSSSWGDHALHLRAL